MTIVPITSPDLDAVEVSWFSALCSDDYQFLGQPDGSLRSSWDHCNTIVKTAEEEASDHSLLVELKKIIEDQISSTIQVLHKKLRHNVDIKILAFF